MVKTHLRSATRGNKSSTLSCSNCSVQLNKLKKLCEAKGLQTSFTDSRHRRFALTMKFFLHQEHIFLDKLLHRHTMILCDKLKHLFLKRKRTTPRNFKLDQFVIEDIKTEVNLPKSAPSDHHTDSSATEVIEVHTAAAEPANGDSLDLLQISQEEVIEYQDNVKQWVECGFPYVDELPQSQYIMPARITERAAEENWLSPELSPIHA